MTVQEIQQALFIDLDDRRGQNQPVGRINVRRLCGPIVEVNNDYVQFFHFTVKEYISSPNINGFISLHDSTLSLILKCLAYLCQQHHNLELSRDAIFNGVSSGTYVLHDFAASSWLELLEQYVQLRPKDTLPIHLTSLLETLVSDRVNYRCEVESTGTGKLKLGKLEEQLPGLYATLSKAAYFRHICSSSQFRIKKGSDQPRLVYS